MLQTASSDRILQWTMNQFVKAAASRFRNKKAPHWQPGEPLKLLFAGYVGGQNTGADVRVEEMIRQIRHILGDDRIELTALTLNLDRTRGYFRTVHQKVLPQIFPKFLYDECQSYDGVIACEGSMFKSKFADALSTMMAGALGIAAAQEKLSVGYGAEAGDMTPGLKAFVQSACKESLIICRNDASQDILSNLGIRTRGGTDTAWTFEPAPLSVGADLLRKVGWDGEKPVLLLCPINPFWWPVRPSLSKFLVNGTTGMYRKIHYKSIYFHHWSSLAESQYHNYLSAWANAVNTFLKTHNYFPVLIGMERLDRKACEDLQKQLTQPTPVMASDEYDMYRLVSILRNGSLMLSSRFHAIVCSMPAQVPSAGVTMDERIQNLLDDRGHSQLMLKVNESNLEEKILQTLNTLHATQDEVANDIGKNIPKQLKRMGQMGIDFVDEVHRVYPEFQTTSLSRTWDQHLPRLSSNLRRLMEVYA